MLEYNEIKPKKFIVFEGEPWEVVSSHVFRKQQRKPVNVVKMKNLISGRVVENSFKQQDKVNEADLEKREIKFLYVNDKKNPPEFWFSNPSNPSDRFIISPETVGDSVKWLKANSIITALLFDGNIIGISLPIKVELKVTEAPPHIKGATATAGNKQVTLENGTNISVPMFIEAGITIVINTETGDYVGKA